MVPDRVIRKDSSERTRANASPERSEGDAASRAFQRYLRKHPEIVGLVPILLDRGDPGGRQFALRAAMLAKTPEMLDALRDFALGQRGPDEQRLEAARAASEAGLFPEGQVRMWLGGQWQDDILLMDFDIHDEPTANYSPQVEEWVAEALDALHERKGKEAERLLRMALEVEPEGPSLLNNLAAAYSLQGREEESETLVRQIHRQYPDYLFARVSLARLAMREGRLDEAEELLKPLLSRRRLHFSEFAALCAVQIELQLAQGRRDSALSWLNLWESADPDNPSIVYWRLRLHPTRRSLLGLRG